MEVSTAIRTKRAVRQFQDKPISEENIRAILNSARLAQSSKNTQPWHFIVIRDRDTLSALSKMGTYAGHLAGAAMGVAIITPPPGERVTIMFDAGQAAAYMQLAAWDLGIGSCLATIYQPEEARELLSFPDKLYLNIAISFGYPSQAEDIHRPPRKSGRRTLDNVVHWERW